MSAGDPAAGAPRAAAGLAGILRGPRGLRAGWRFALFALLLTLFNWLSGLAVTAAGVRVSARWTPANMTGGEALQLAEALAAIGILAAFERRTLADYGLPLRRVPWRGLLAGTLWGFAAVGVLAGLMAAFGAFRVHGLALHGGALAGTAAGWAVAMLLVGLSEELAFRGYVLRVLADGMGFWPAAVLLSLLFGALHFFTKPFETPADFASVGLIGLFLCWTLRRTGSLWWAVGFHAAFDFAQLPLLGGPNSGNGGTPVDARLLATSFPGPAALTGGRLGMEASLCVFPVIAALFLLFPLRHREVRFPPAPGR